MDALPAGRDTVIWDRALTGFGVRVYPSGAKVYVVQTRGPAGTKRITVGRHGVIGAAEARHRAALIIARIRAGEDLAEHKAQKPAGPTLAVLAERYLREHVAVRCKPSTAAQYRLAIERYIVPALGERAVSEIGRSQVADLQHALRDRPAMANLVIATLSRLIDQAVAWGVVQETTNPCRSAQKYRVRRRERFLTDAEFRRLGNALDELEATGRLSPHAAAAIRLLMLTGCRRNEILTLRWEDVHLEAHELRLPDSKTGPRTISLSVEAAEVLAALPKVPGNPWVIPGTRTGQRLSSIFEPWSRVRARAGLDDVRIHDLRHSYASRALALGESLPVIAKLPRPRPDPDNRPLHPPHQRLRQRRRNARRKRHRKRYLPGKHRPPNTPYGRSERRRAGPRTARWEPPAWPGLRRLDAGGRTPRKALMPGGIPRSHRLPACGVLACQHAGRLWDAASMA